VTTAAAVHGRPWRRLVRSVLAESDVCWLCGHAGSQSGDHVIPRSVAPHLTLVRSNVRPAHGIAGCPTCGRKCNQSRGNGRSRQYALPFRTSRRW
jgi:5-methylcytosine-specific restriction endonuclease McrA